jgi:hypothetical protein
MNTCKEKGPSPVDSPELFLEEVAEVGSRLSLMGLFGF